MNDIREKDQYGNYIYRERGDHTSHTYLLVHMSPISDLYNIAIHEEIRRFNSGDPYTSIKEQSIALTEDQVKHLISKLELLVKK